jgi:hypothetical protein
MTVKGATSAKLCTAPTSTRFGYQVRYDPILRLLRGLFEHREPFLIWNYRGLK